MALAATPPLVCPAGAPIGNVDLRVRSVHGGETLPLRTINRLEEGESILYQPILRPKEVRKGEVAIVLVPVSKQPDQDSLVVLEPHKAAEPAEWQVPSRSAVVGFVYGPAGLSRGKVKRFLSKDTELVSQLADYAEKTAQTEALIQALSTDASSATVDSAFQGFASQYGFAGQIDRTASTNQQMVGLFRTLNPAIASYDPISPQSSQRIGQTASLATSVAAFFFGSPVGLAAGGAAMLMQMRSLAFPDTVFRSSFAETMPNDGLGLCGKRDAVPAHTRVAYLWAARVPNIAPPHVSVAKPLSLAIGLKSAIPVEVASDQEWKYIDRARSWTLERAGQPPMKVAVHKVEPKGLEIDLTKTHLEPGAYQLQAWWDWDQFSVQGDVPVEALSDFSRVRLKAESQDRLIAKTGKVAVTLEGGDFEFVTKAELERPGDKFFTTVAIPFALPMGPRQGRQERMDVQVNTAELEPGDYRLQLTQTDGKPHPAPLMVLAAPSTIENLPILINRGDTREEITLKGGRLNLLTRLEMPEGTAALGPPQGEGERTLTLSVKPDLPSGAVLAMRGFQANRSQPILFPEAVRIIGPRPKIAESRLSLPSKVGVSLNAGELPSGVFLTALLKVDFLGPNSGLKLSCGGDPQPLLSLRAGEKSGAGSLEQMGGDQLFLTFDTGRFPSGCALEAATESGDRGDSKPYALGRVIRVPKIERFVLAAVPADTGAYEGALTGADLEVIEKVGWGPENGSAVTELPAVESGEPHRQTLRIELPTLPPTPDAPLYIWLRGEAAGRATEARLPPPVKATSAR